MKGRLLGPWVLMVALLGSGFAQTLVLTNGDVNGDNLIDDADQLAVIFAMGQSCPSGCPEDLDGNRVVDDADLLIVLFNFGAQGAETFAGQVQAPQGAFTVRLTLRLGDWVGGAQQVKVQLKPVGTKRDANVPIYEYSASVGGNDTVVDLANLPAGVYTVRVFPVSLGRWLRVEGKLLTEVPWIFAAPTGIDRETMTDKVTVYWDEVPGATGYRVRWRKSNENDYPPGNVVVVGADVRQQSVARLEREQEYYFVVEAAYNGLWGPPSEEDSAVPHEGAIPWDTQDPNQIIPAARDAFGAFYGDISILSPDGRYYTEIGWVRQVQTTAPYGYNATESTINSADGGLVMPVQRHEESLLFQGCTTTGPFRRIRTRASNSCIGAKGQFYLPLLSCISVDTTTHGTTRDTPHVYFGIAYRVSQRRAVDIEGGISFHPAGRGVRRGNREEGGQLGSPPPDYARWIPYLRVRDGRNDTYQPIVGDASRSSNHLSYGSYGQEAPYGFIVDIDLQIRYRKKCAVLNILAWRVLIDEDPFWSHFFVSFADVPQPGTAPRTRRVISIAQRERFTGSNGWVRTNSWFCNIGVGYQPLFDIHDLNPIEAFCGSWQCWTPGLTENEEKHCPPNSPIFLVDENVGEQTCGGTNTTYYREVVGIDLRRR
jgi:hypothetical protein